MFWVIALASFADVEISSLRSLVSQSLPRILVSSLDSSALPIKKLASLTDYGSKSLARPPTRLPARPTARPLARPPIRLARPSARSPVPFAPKVNDVVLMWKPGAGSSPTRPFTRSRRDPAALS